MLNFNDNAMNKLYNQSLNVLQIRNYIVRLTLSDLFCMLSVACLFMFYLEGKMCSLSMKVKSKLKRNRQIFYRTFFLVVVGTYLYASKRICDYRYNESGPSFYDAWQQYGLFSIFLYSLTLSTYLNVPIAFFNLVGMLMYNPFQTVERKTRNTCSAPLICFRVVTRGLFPNLVADVTKKNINICNIVGITNFKFEIVTDTSLGLQSSYYVREIVIPREYQTPNRTLFKARALHYCLGSNINILSQDDWIVHLDEETLLTDSALHGIVNFVSQNDSNIGQGVITYGESGIENWLTTLLDGMRVAIDYGLYRLALQLFHRPLFGFKGSFIVVKMEIENKIGFDFGPKESIAEDLRFALSAWDHGYRFDFVEGVMKEKSTFSLTDYVKQRKRWFIGHYHIVWGSSIPFYCKGFVMIMHLSSTLLVSNVAYTILSMWIYVPLQKWQVYLFTLLTFNVFLLLAFGNFMSICSRMYSLWKRVALSFLSQCLLPVLAMVEAYATIKGLLHRNIVTFDIVQKETNQQLQK